MKDIIRKTILIFLTPNHAYSIIEWKKCQYNFLYIHLWCIIKKGEDDLNLVLTRDNDILKYLGEIKSHQILVGFAAESNDVEENALKKIKSKNLDFIVANDITKSDTGFGSDDNKVIIMSKENKTYLEKMSKREVAKNIFDMILGKH